MRLAAGSIVLALVTGCGGSGSGQKDARDDEPSAPASSSSSSRLPAELLELEEPEPPALRGDGRPADVEPIVDYLVAAMSHTLRTSFAPGQLFTRSACAVCQEVVDLSAEAGRDRIRYELGDWEPEVGEVEVLPGNRFAARYLRVVVRLGRPELRAVDEQGTVVDVVPPSDPVTVLVVRGGEHWDVFVWDELAKLQNQEGA